ncbi:hypothetical protein U9M48_019446 [Paspalum notatum var. saurae]|uniref:Uncharacterized protein n=1 Tax=Paspalum notatum var. saurae TaxID=547442 RepID=A0AAQ3TFD9_PASNO
MALVTARGDLVTILVFRVSTDSTGAISIARDPVKHELTKHIGVDAYYTRARVRDDVITLRYVPELLRLALESAAAAAALKKAGIDNDDDKSNVEDDDLFLHETAAPLNLHAEAVAV